MEPLHLIEIGEDGNPTEDVALTDLTRSVCEATAGLYQRVGFQRPWIGYLAEEDSQVVGMCGFKSPPQNGRVEIAYGTTPGNEGRGIATQMARQLVQMARETEQGIIVLAQTLPEEGASTAILRKLGFSRTATVQHPDDGEVWEWSLTMAHPPTLRKPGEGRRIGVVGDVYRFLATGEDTDGKYATFEAIVPPGSGPPPHIHSREEESFLVLEGEMTFQLGEDRFVAEAGTFLNMPVGSLHCFKNESNKSARLLISVAPAGLEKMFFEVGQPLADNAEAAPPPSQADIERLLEAAPRYGVEIKVPHG